MHPGAGRSARHKAYRWWVIGKVCTMTMLLRVSHWSSKTGFEAQNSLALKRLRAREASNAYVLERSIGGVLHFLKERKYFCGGLVMLRLNGTSSLQSLSNQLYGLIKKNLIVTDENRSMLEQRTV